MTSWTNGQLARIGAAHEIEVAPFRNDGSQPRPVVVWVVRHGDDLFIRSWRGADAAWFRRARRNRQGVVVAAGDEVEVGFVEADTDLNDGVDAAYRRKYGRAGSYVDQMVSARARATTVRLMPRQAAPDGRRSA
jgi:hypothetical protein